jgi:hypothetical protein
MTPSLVIVKNLFKLSSQYHTLGSANICDMQIICKLFSTFLENKTKKYIALGEQNDMQLTSLGIKNVHCIL